MDYTLIALIGLIVLTVVASSRYRSRTWSGRPGHQYQRVITVGIWGLWLTVAGAIGWDLSHAHGFFPGDQVGRWSNLVASRTRRRLARAGSILGAQSAITCDAQSRSPVVQLGRTQHHAWAARWASVA